MLNPNSIEGLLLASEPHNVSRRTEKMPQENKRNMLSTVNWSAYLQGDQSEAGKCILGEGLWQKSLWLGPSILDNRLSNDVQNIRQSKKVHLGSHEKLENKFTAGGKTSSWCENPERHFQGEALSPLLFVIAMMLNNHILRKWNSTNKFTKS